MMNILVKYNKDKGYFAAKTQIESLLRKWDEKAEAELLSPGIIGITTKIDARKLIEDIQDQYATDPTSLRMASTWWPADNWCDANLDAIKKLIVEECITHISEDENYTVDVQNHKEGLDKEELVEIAKQLFKGTLVEEHPDKIFHVDVFGSRAAVSILKPRRIFEI